MNATMHVDGVDEIEKSMKDLAKKFGKKNTESAMISGQLIRSEAIKSIQDTSNGERQTRTRLGGNKRTVIASKAGDAPNTDTGTLVSSIHVEISPSHVSVGSSLKYALWLEFGTWTMEPRPWLYPAVEKNREKIFDIFAGKIKQVTQEGL